VFRVDRKVFISVVCVIECEIQSVSVRPQHCRVILAVSRMDRLLVIRNYVERVVSQIEDISRL